MFGSINKILQIHRRVAKLSRVVEKLLKEEILLMHTIDELVAEVARFATLEAQVEAVLAASAGSAAKIDQAFSALKAADDRLQAVVTGTGTEVA